MLFTFNIIEFYFSIIIFYRKLMLINSVMPDFIEFVIWTNIMPVFYEKAVDWNSVSIFHHVSKMPKNTNAIRPVNLYFELSKLPP